MDGSSNEFTSPSSALNAHLDAARTGDAALLKRAFWSDGRFVGTDDTEVWGSSTLIKLLEDSHGVGWEMELTSERLLMKINPELVSFVEFLNHKLLGRMRGSGLVQFGHDGQWRIRDYVLSFSVPNTVADDDRFLELIADT